MSGPDPYSVLGVTEGISDTELRRVYRALVKQHHPDHNGGSAESAVRFARIQDAYSEITRLRSGIRSPGTAASSQAAASQAAASPPPSPAAGGDPDLEQRIRNMEHDIAAVSEEKRRRARDTAATAAAQAAARQRAAYEAVAAAGQRRPTPEELGYFSTEDSITKIVDDAAEQLGQRLRSVEAKRQFARRLTDLFGDER